MPATLQQQTGAQFDLFSQDQSKFEALTLRLIRAFDTALREKGYAARIGMEEEFSIDAPSLTDEQAYMGEEDSRAHKRGTDRKPEYVRRWLKSDEFASNMLKAIHDSYHALEAWNQERARNNAETHEQKFKPKKAEPPTISRFEHTARGNKHRFEIVTEALGPVRVAMLGRAIMRGFFLGSEEGQEHAKEKGISTFVQRILDNAPAYTKVRFNPADCHTVYSQHGSVSLQAKIGGKKVNLMTKKLIAEKVSLSLKNITRRDLLVLMTGDFSRARLNRGHLDPHHLRDMADATIIHNESPETARVEYRIPDSSTHPYLTVLTIMAACYDAVKDVPPPGEPFKKEKRRMTETKIKSQTASINSLNLNDSVYYGRHSAFSERSLLLPLIEDALISQGETSRKAKSMATEFKNEIIKAYKQNDLSKF